MTIFIQTHRKIITLAAAALIALTLGACSGGNIDSLPTLVQSISWLGFG